MEDNPYSLIVKKIREDNKAQMPVSFRFGTVLSINPLKINVAKTIQDGNSLLKNSMIESFDIGDNVLLVPIDDEQRYIILCKVVSI